MCAMDLHKYLAISIRVNDGRIANRVSATRDARFDLSEGDLVRDQNCGLQAGAASAL